jgi:hypothetical protein
MEIEKYVDAKFKIPVKKSSIPPVSRNPLPSSDTKKLQMGSSAPQKCRNL